MNLSRSRWAALGAAVAVVAGAGGLGLAQAAPSSSVSSFQAMIPCRMLDTRSLSQIGGVAAPVGANSTVTLRARGAVGDCEIPVEATALSVNVIAVHPESDTYLTLFPAGIDRPEASQLNASVGEVESNGFDVALSAGGELSVYNSSGPTDVVIDVLGVYVPAGSGSAGEPGPQGEPGVQGEPGPQGEPGVAGYEIVSVEVLMSPDSLRTATCPDGKFAVGGGFDPVMDGPFEFLGSYPTADGTGWTIGDGDFFRVDGTLYAVCLSAS